MSAPDPVAALEIGLCWGTLVQADLPTLIEAAGRHGFPTLSVRADAVLDAIEGGTSPAMLRRRLSDARVRVRVVDAIRVGLPGGQARRCPTRRHRRGIGGDLPARDGGGRRADRQHLSPQRLHRRPGDASRDDRRGARDRRRSG